MRNSTLALKVGVSAVQQTFGELFSGVHACGTRQALYGIRLLILLLCRIFVHGHAILAVKFTQSLPIMALQLVHPCVLLSFPKKIEASVGIYGKRRAIDKTKNYFGGTV